MLSTNNILAPYENVISQCPFLLIASGASSRGADISPRGDAPGFVESEGGCLLLPDRIGNNRLDTIKNIIDNPAVALLLFCPLLYDVLQVSGLGDISTDPDLLKRFEFKNTLPKTVIIIRVTQAALIRVDGLKQAEFWLSGLRPRPAIASMGDILADQVSGLSRSDANNFVDTSYRERVY